MAYTNEAKRCIQCRNDPLASFACQAAGNCGKSYYDKRTRHVLGCFNFTLILVFYILGLF